MRSAMVGRSRKRWGAGFGPQSFAALRYGVSPWRRCRRTRQLRTQRSAGGAAGGVGGAGLGVSAVARRGAAGPARRYRAEPVCCWRQHTGSDDSFENRLRHQRQSGRAARPEKIVRTRPYPSITIDCRAFPMVCAYTAAVAPSGVAFFRPCSKQRACITSPTATACCTPRTWI